MGVCPLGTVAVSLAGSPASLPPADDHPASTAIPLVRYRWAVGAVSPHWAEVELAAVEWMRRLGFSDAAATRPGPDGGVDIRATGAAAQVKAFSIPVSRPDVQRLRGAAYDVEHALFFSWNGYSPNAQSYANAVGVALFTFDGSVESILPSSVAATELWSRVNSETRSGVVSGGRRSKQRSGNVPKWSTIGRALGYFLFACLALAFIFFVVVVFGPILLFLGAEAKRRAGDDLFTWSTAEGERNRALAVAAGVLGTVVLVTMIVQNIAWSISSDRPPDGNPDGWAVLGVVVSVLVIAGLLRVVAAGHGARFRLPRRLDVAAPATVTKLAPSDPGGEKPAENSEH